MPDPALFRSFAINTQGQDYVVGDLHGCFSALEIALQRLGFDPAVDRLFAIGDLVDRGPESERFLEVLRQPWFHAIRGNHDQMMIDAQDDPDWQVDWMRNGGGWSEHQPTAVLSEGREALDALPLAIEIQTQEGWVGLVHANPMSATWAELKERLTSWNPERPLRLAEGGAFLTGLLWSRTLVHTMAKAHRDGVEMAPIPDLRALVVGHTVVRQPLVAGNIWAIDTGACYGLPDSALTLLRISDLALLQLALSGNPPN